MQLFGGCAAVWGLCSCCGGGLAAPSPAALPSSCVGIETARAVPPPPVTQFPPSPGLGLLGRGGSSRPLPQSSSCQLRAHGGGGGLGRAQHSPRGWSWCPAACWTAGNKSLFKGTAACITLAGIPAPPRLTPRSRGRGVLDESSEVPWDGAVSPWNRDRPCGGSRERAATSPRRAPRCPFPCTGLGSHIATLTLLKARGLPRLWAERWQQHRAPGAVAVPGNAPFPVPVTCAV